MDDDDDDPLADCNNSNENTMFLRPRGDLVMEAAESVFHIHLFFSNGYYLQLIKLRS